MSDTPGEHLTEEPQDERGEPGTRDTGSDEPAGGPVDRPEGKADEGSDTTVNPQETQPESPDMQSGGG